MCYCLLFQVSCDASWKLKRRIHDIFESSQSCELHLVCTLLNVAFIDTLIKIMHSISSYANDRHLLFLKKKKFFNQDASSFHFKIELKAFYQYLDVSVYMKQVYVCKLCDEKSFSERNFRVLTKWVERKVVKSSRKDKSVYCLRTNWEKLFQEQSSWCTPYWTIFFVKTCWMWFWQYQ